MLTRDEINRIRTEIRGGRGLNNYLPNLCNQASRAIDLQAKLDSLHSQIQEPCEWCGIEEQRNAHGRIFYKAFPHESAQLTTLDDSHLQLAYDEINGRVLHFEDDDGERMFDVKISTCPSCGRKLPELPEGTP